uniref:Uncharacterized protein n=1 Tax=Oryza nivara TaxID=4536 RepID=A0A0E0G5B4_ORYNI
MAVATRTGKPSLDMFLAEMRRFEVLPSAVKNCWNVTSLLLLARSLLLAPVYCRRAAASSPEPLSSPSAAGAEKLIFLLSWLYFLSSHLTFTSRNEMMADYLLDHCDVPLRFKDMHKSKVILIFQIFISIFPLGIKDSKPIFTYLHPALCYYSRLTLWPTGDFGKILSCFTMAFHCLVHEIVSASCMVVQLFGDIKEEITIWREAGFM